MQKLYIHADDGSIYEIGEDQWEELGVMSATMKEVPGNRLEQMVDSGALVAVMPAALNVGGICTLVSIKNLPKPKA